MQKINLSVRTALFAFAFFGAPALALLAAAAAGLAGHRRAAWLALVSGLVRESVSGGAEVLDLLALSTLPIAFAAKLFPDAADEIPNSIGLWALAYLVVVLAAIAVLLRRYRAGVDA